VRRRVGIIGTGWVGSSVAISTLHSGVADELLLNDARMAVAEGEALDLAQGAAFYPRALVRAAALDELIDSDAVVIAAGRNGRPDESRLALLRDNVRVAREIARPFRHYRGVIIVVSNPVDILTRVVADETELPAGRVIGSGTMLDTARLRQVIGQTLSVDPHSVHAYVVGEHGDSEVALWSDARIAGVALRQWPGWLADREAAMAETVRRAAYEIIKRKGATNHAIGLVTADLLSSVLRDERRVLTVSRMQSGVAGVTDVVLSLPAIVGAAGAAEVLAPNMDDNERERLLKSADVLRTACATLG
jgi:L-lactate dehydrogenase